jgi:hypothetical protein
VRVVDTAKPPSAPFRPRTRLNLVLGLLLGAGLGVGMAFFLDYLDSTLVAAEDARAAAGLPVLAGGAAARGGGGGSCARRAVPRAGSADLVAHHEPKSRISEAYRELRTAILLSSAQQAPRRIMVTSAVPEEGKSQTAMNLAIVLAQLGRRVLLDRHRPQAPPPAPRLRAPRGPRALQPPLGAHRAARRPRARRSRASICWGAVPSLPTPASC